MKWNNVELNQIERKESESDVHRRAPHIFVEGEDFRSYDGALFLLHKAMSSDVPENKNSEPS